jgi:hypothetical protein
MYLLNPLVEAYVGGSITAWPRVILKFLFHLPPTTFTTTAIAAFFFGNGVPRSMTVQLVQACTAGATDDMLHDIIASYNEWSTYPDVGHHTVYWNMRIQKFVWLNGSNGPQLEILASSVIGRSNDTVTGFGCQPYTWPLRRRLEYIRRNVYFSE